MPSPIRSTRPLAPSRSARRPVPPQRLDRVAPGRDPLPPSRWAIQSAALTPRAPQYPAALEDRPGDRPETLQLKQQYRGAWNEAEQAYQQALRAGRSEVVTTRPDGTSQSIRIDEATGRVYVQERGRDGKLIKSLYRDGTTVTKNGGEDGRESGRETTIFRMRDGQPQKVTADRERRGVLSTVQPDGTLKTQDYQVPNDQEAGRRNSVIPALRAANLRDADGNPLDGRGQVIGDIDAYDEFTGRSDDHAMGVRDTSTGQDHGVAPGARFQPFSPGRGGSFGSAFNGGPTGPDFRKLPDDPRKLREAILAAGPAVTDRVTNRLRQLLDDPNRDPNMRIMNLSLGSSRADYYDAVKTMLDGNNPQTRAEILGPDADRLSDEEKARKIAAYTDRPLDDPQSEYSQALQRWRDTAHRAASPPYNMSLVLAAGNSGPGSHSQNALWEKVHPGSQFNDMGSSPDVITVGAGSERQGLWGNSSWGNPTLLAPGQDQFFEDGRVESGTSLAAPFVAGTIALMLQANPNLTPAQIQELLVAASTPLPGVDPHAQGAGVLNPERAVQAALKLRR